MNGPRNPANSPMPIVASSSSAVANRWNPGGGPRYTYPPPSLPREGHPVAVDPGRVAGIDAIGDAGEAHVRPPLEEVDLVIVLAHQSGIDAGVEAGRHPRP